MISKTRYELYSKSEILKEKIIKRDVNEGYTFDINHTIIGGDLIKVLKEFYRLSILTEPSSEANFLKSLERLKFLLLHGKLTDSEVAKLLELINDLILVI